MKIFLSHSSSDKDIVGKVFNALGAGICHYDIATFDPTGFLPEQINTALNESTHFVLFASAKALNSKWVEGELRSAFASWMHSNTKRAMVFLMRDGERTAVPAWLQDFVITEHPSPHHIACRILGEYDDQQKRPPSYRTDEVKTLEKKIAVEASKMPPCTLICGTDGMGRKELINELFVRRFRNVPRRKILLYSESFDSDIDLYKSLKGAIALTSARELSAEINRLGGLSIDQRLNELSRLIVHACQCAQTIILDATDSIFTDSGELIDWLEKLIEILPPSNYPLLNITTIRRPNFVKTNINEKIAQCYLEPLKKDDSTLLFDWWLKELDVSLHIGMTELILEHVTGNPKLIEASVRLIKTIPDANDIRNIKKYVFPDLERSASKLFANVANDNLSKLMLSFAVDCGHINLSDLVTTVSVITGTELNKARDCYSNLVAYGFLQSDSISVKVPNFITRAAKSIGQKEPILTNLKKCWSALADTIATIQLDEETSISVINEACVLKLKLGTNSIIGIESLILPSQCLRIAKQSYDQNNFELAYQLSERAFQSRLALTEDAAIEALRYCGMSAARENAHENLNTTLQLFKLTFPRKIVFQEWRKINVTFEREANAENTEAGIHAGI